jgi:3-oxoadipate enol-lactonase
MALPTIDVSRERFNCRIDGPADAPVLVLSNSLGADLSMWEPQMPALTRRFRVLRYDQRGHGASTVTPAARDSSRLAYGAYSLETLARDVLTLLDALKVKRAHFCGVSMGGATGMWLAANAPERIDRLVLANTAPKFSTPEAWKARIDAVRKGGVEAIADAVLERWFTSGFRARDPETAARMRKIMVATPIAGYIGCCTAIRDTDLRDALPKIAAPTLVIVGTHDPANPPAEGRAFAARIPGARVVELDAAHISNVEAPEAFTAALVGFLHEEGR